MGDANPIRTLGDYSKPSHEGYKITIELPKGNNVLAIGLNVFQQDTRFLAQFFPPGRTAKLRNDILIRNDLEINLLWKTISEKLDDTPIHNIVGSPAAQMNFTSANDLTKEELRGKGIKRPSKLLFLKYLSQSSLVEQNRNPSSPKRIHFVNSIVILNKEDEAKEEGNMKSSITEYEDHEMTVESEEEEKDMVNNREIIESIVEPSKSEEEEPLKKLSKLTNERPAETDIRLSLASLSYIYPLGIAEDVLVDVAGYVYPIKGRVPLYLSSSAGDSNWYTPLYEMGSHVEIGWPSNFATSCLEIMFGGLSHSFWPWAKFSMVSHASSPLNSLRFPSAAKSRSAFESVRADAVMKDVMPLLDELLTALVWLCDAVSRLSGTISSRVLVVGS
ncbi:hypothetical protein Tco_0769526 [Tanacetum coccineum]|uniref:Uncharacterized protein n=1 Tax=Tanacetum coccineum TaxID=301880 RepID=A0ABQ4ZCW8_9ASTR